MENRSTLAEVAVDAPVRTTLTYILPQELEQSASIGVRAIVPLGNRKVTGYLVGFPKSSDLQQKKLKKIIDIIDPLPLFDQDMLGLLRWAAAYYFVPLAETIKTALPAGINVASRKTVTLTPAGRDLVERHQPGDHDHPPGLDPALMKALFAIARQEGGLKTGARAHKAPPAPAIRKLEKMDLVQLTQQLAPPRVKEKTERALAPLSAPTPEQLESIAKRAPEQARLLAELMERGPATLRELRRKFKDPSRLGRALISAGLAEHLDSRAMRDPFAMDLEVGPPPEKLMPEQEQAVETVARAVAAGKFRVFLLQGVTGSGKTEVYLRAIQRAADAGKTSILLVPEIALTPQLIARFRQRFSPEDLAVLHSGLSPGERLDQWERIRTGRARIVVGARSAVFAPVRDLGVIVVDEEQESAYKQDHGFMYNARDLAVMRAHKCGAVALLGSATPSLESSHRAGRADGYEKLSLPRRVDDRPLPAVEVVDLKEERMDLPPLPGGPGEDRVRERDRLMGEALLSSTLKNAVIDTLDRGEQVILFINRRGSSSFILCFDCGQRLTCPNCSVSLVHHRRPTAHKVDRFYGEPGEGGYVLCHYCGYHQPLPEVCPSCRGVRVTPFGSGTEQVEEAMGSLFPKARSMRLDSDVMTGRKSWYRSLDLIARGRVDIVVGTQLVAKGHDLPGVTLVGVVLADLTLNMPDFRSSERTFQMLTQVAGRAGRGKRPGRVIIQTFQPENYSVRLAVAQDYPGFYAEEAAVRRALFYPPFSRLANFRLQGLDREAVRKASSLLAGKAKRKAVTRAFKDKVRVLGPAPAPIARIRGKHRWMFLVKAVSPAVLTAFCEALQAALGKSDLPPSVSMEIDRDPASMM